MMARTGNAVAGTVAAPWPRSDRVVVGALQALGFGLLALSWLGVSGTTTFSRQIAWVNVGGAGLLAVVFGAALWVHRGRRLVGQRLGFDVSVRRPARAAGPTGLAQAVDTFVSAAGMSRYHRPDCPAVAGKSVTGAGADAHRAEGRRPCGLCFWETPPSPRGEP
jgi:hypothetical protein